MRVKSKSIFIIIPVTYLSKWLYYFTGGLKKTIAALFKLIRSAIRFTEPE